MKTMAMKTVAVADAAQKAVHLNWMYLAAVTVCTVLSIPWSLLAWLYSWALGIGAGFVQCYAVAWIACTVVFCIDFRKIHLLHGLQMQVSPLEGPPNITVTDDRPSVGNH